MNALFERSYKVLVVDSIPLVRFALIQLVQNHPRTTVVGEARAVAEARRLCEERQPDLVVLNVHLGSGDGLEVIRDLPRLHALAQAVVMSEEESANVVHRAFRAGARGYVTWRDEPGELVNAVEEVVSGRLHASPRVSYALLSSLVARKPEAIPGLKLLSDRELHVFRLMGRQLGATAIARELGVTVKTIESHQSRIKDKMNVQNCRRLRELAEGWSRANPESDGD